MLPFTPEGVLLQEGDVRQEPPFVLALSASTPYRVGQQVT
jgi:gamma-glutamyl:cysteine ligase YbdK (ATP-grasp superfamily)